MTSVAQLVGHHPEKQKVTSSIPDQGTCLGCGPGPWLGVCERQLIDVSFYHTWMFLFLCFFLPSSLSKNK